MIAPHGRSRAFVSAVVLAAGGSTRLGRPKQLLRVGGESLVARAVRAAGGPACSETIVVLGAGADAVRAELASLPVRTVVNAGWPTGIASSIRTGLSAVDAAADAVLFVVCDQPALNAGVLDGLVEAFRAGTAGIVASGYAGTLGVPALFARSYFEELAALRGDTGARSVIRAHSGDVVERPFAGGEEDVDTPEDARRLFP